MLEKSEPEYPILINTINSFKDMPKFQFLESMHATIYVVIFRDIWMVTKSNHRHPHKTNPEKDIRKRRKNEGTDRDRSNAATRKECPQPLELEGKKRTDSFCSVSEGHASQLISWFIFSKTYLLFKFYVFLFISWRDISSYTQKLQGPFPVGQMVQHPASEMLWCLDPVVFLAMRDTSAGNWKKGVEVVAPDA